MVVQELTCLTIIKVSNITEKCNYLIEILAINVTINKCVVFLNAHKVTSTALVVLQKCKPWDAYYFQVTIIL